MLKSNFCSANAALSVYYYFTKRFTKNFAEMSEREGSTLRFKPRTRPTTGVCQTLSKGRKWQNATPKSRTPRFKLECITSDVHVDVQYQLIGVFYPVYSSNLITLRDSASRRCYGSENSNETLRRVSSLRILAVIVGFHGYRLPWTRLQLSRGTYMNYFNEVFFVVCIFTSEVHVQQH